MNSQIMELPTVKRQKSTLKPNYDIYRKTIQEMNNDRLVIEYVSLLGSSMHDNDEWLERKELIEELAKSRGRELPAPEKLYSLAQEAKERIKLRLSLPEASAQTKTIWWMLPKYSKMWGCQ